MSVEDEAKLDDCGDLRTISSKTHLTPTSTDRLRCSECGAFVTVDPFNGTEYGHVRKQWGDDKYNGPCPYRPQSFQPVHGDH